MQRRPHLFGLAETPERHEPGQRVVHRRDGGRLWAAVHHHRRLDPSGADGVHPDPMARILEGRRPRKTHDAVFRRVVRPEVRIARDAHQRGSVHDRTTVLGHHLAELALHAEEDPCEIDGEHPVPRFLVVLGEASALAADAGVVERAIQPAEPLDAPVDERLDLSGIGHVALYEERFGASLARQSDGFTAARLVDIGEEQLAPSSANTSAVARPIPEAAPVTSATLPSRMPRVTTARQRR